MFQLLHKRVYVFAPFAGHKRRDSAAGTVLALQRAVQRQHMIDKIVHEVAEARDFLLRVDGRGQQRVDVAVAGMAEDGAVIAVFVEQLLHSVDEAVEVGHGSRHVLEDDRRTGHACSGHAGEDAVAHAPQFLAGSDGSGERVEARQAFQGLYPRQQCAHLGLHFFGSGSAVVDEHGRGAPGHVHALAEVRFQRGVVHHLDAQGSRLAQPGRVGGRRRHCREIEHGR